MPRTTTPSRPAPTGARAGGGRRSFGVDVGGTTVKGLLLDADGCVEAEHRVRTPAPDPDGRRVAAAVHDVAAALGHLPGEPLGVALPGVVDERAGVAVRSANLGWADLAVTDLLPPGATLCHDVRAGAVAEARSGAARGAEGVVAFVPVGTGIAAAVLVDGVPLVAGGFAGEIGQLVLTDGPFRGLRTEEVASAAATARRAGCAGAREVAEAVRAGDPAARRVWDETVEVLAGSLAGLVAVAAPAVLVVGGGLALSGDLLLDPLRRRLDELLPGLRPPRIVPAVHGDAAAALGAALLAGEAHDVAVRAEPV